MVGGKFQGSNTSSSSGFVDLHTITADPTSTWTEVTISNTNAYRYVRYIAPQYAHGNVAEIEFYGTSSTVVSSFSEKPLNILIIPRWYSL
jgi:hypothetical protein